MAENVEIRKSLVMINSVSSVLTRLIKITVLAWLLQHLLNRVSPGEYSVLALLMTLMMFAPLFTAILTSGLSRYTVEAYARGDKRRIVQIVSTMLPLLALAALGVLTLGGLFIWQIDHVFVIESDHVSDARIMMMAMISLLALQMVLSPFGQGLYIKQKFVLTNLIKLGCECLRLGLLLGLLLGISTRVIWVVFASVASDLTALLLIVGFSRYYVPALKFDRREISWSVTRELLPFGFLNMITQVADKMSTGAGTLILNLFSSAIQVNYFYVGTLLLRQLQMTEYIATRPLMPVLTAMHALDSHDRLRSAYLRGGRLGLWMMLMVVVPIIIYRNEVITLWLGPDKLLIATIMGMMMAFIPIQYGNNMLSKLSVAKGYLRPWALRAIGTQIVNVCLTFYLVAVREMGAIGAALSWIMVLVVGELFFMIPLGLRLADVPVRQWLKCTVLPGLLPALVAACLWLIMQQLVKPESLVSLMLCVMVGLAAYVAVLLIYCLQKKDREDFKKMTDKLRYRFGRRTLQAPLPK